MNKEDFRLWLENRITTQNRLVLAAAIVMTIGALLTNWIEFYVLRYFTTFYFGWLGAWVSSGAALALLILILGFTWLRMPSKLTDSVHTATVDGAEVPVHIAPAMGIVWTFALGSIESDRTWLEWGIGLMALPQRLACGAIYLFKRVQQFGLIDVDTCASIIRLLYRHNERVEVAKIASRHPDMEITSALRELSLIDGITFLTRQSVGVSLAPRLSEELNNLGSPQTESAGYS